jgi:hypothetical protein
LAVAGGINGREQVRELIALDAKGVQRGTPWKFSNFPDARRDPPACEMPQPQHGKQTSQAEFALARAE